jgi:hypothetical protein
LITTPTPRRATRLHFAISTNLKVGDALLIVAGDGTGEQLLRLVGPVSDQEEQSVPEARDRVSRTEVTLQKPLPTVAFESDEPPALLALQALHTALDPFISDASSLFSGGEKVRGSSGRR